MKKWHESKEVIFNIVLTIINVASVLEGYIPQEVGVAVQGIGTIILRVWFTKSQIEKSIR